MLIESDQTELLRQNVIVSLILLMFISCLFPQYSSRIIAEDKTRPSEIPKSGKRLGRFEVHFTCHSSILSLSRLSLIFNTTQIPKEEAALHPHGPILSLQGGRRLQAQHKAAYPVKATSIAQF